MPIGDPVAFCLQVCSMCFRKNSQTPIWVSGICPQCEAGVNPVQPSTDWYAEPPLEDGLIGFPRLLCERSGHEANTDTAMVGRPCMCRGCYWDRRVRTLEEENKRLKDS